MLSFAYTFFSQPFPCTSPSKFIFAYFWFRSSPTIPTSSTNFVQDIQKYFPEYLLLDFSDEIHLALAFKILPLLREILPPLPPISSSFQVFPLLPTGFSTDTARPVFSSDLLCSSPTSTSLTLFWKPPQMYAQTEMHRSSANWTLQPHFHVPQRSQLYHWMPQKLVQETTFWEYLGTAGSFFLILTTEG